MELESVFYNYSYENREGSCDVIDVKLTYFKKRADFHVYVDKTSINNLNIEFKFISFNDESLKLTNFPDSANDTREFPTCNLTLNVVLDISPVMDLHSIIPIISLEIENKGLMIPKDLIYIIIDYMRSQRVIIRIDHSYVEMDDFSEIKNKTGTFAIEGSKKN